MTRNEAFTILVKHCDSEPMVIDAFETPDWWIFSVAPKGSSLNAGVIVGPRFLIKKEDKTVITEDDIDMREVLSMGQSESLKSHMIKILSGGKHE